jgi:anti-sigma factor RsiW
VKDEIDLLDLSAYLDGELDGSGRARVEKVLNDDPEAAARLSGYRRRDAALRAGFATLPQPAKLLVWPKSARTAPGARGGRLAAAALLVACIGAIALGWWNHAEWRATDRELASLFQDATNADLIYSARPEADGSGIQEQLSARLAAVLGARIKTPDLSALGFRLVGALEFVTAQPPAVLLVYRDGRGREVSCYFRRAPTAAETGFRQGQLAGTKVLYRLTDRVAYAVLGALEPGELRRIAEAAYAQTGIDSER